MKKVITNSRGFTLVELMVVVAIIGILSAVAVPNFKKYQAKSKQSEAKIQLAMVYTVENTAMSDYDTYGTCLEFLGYEINPRGYYAVGFQTAYTTGNDQINSRAGSAACTGNRWAPATPLYAGSNTAATVTFNGGTAAAQSTFTAGAVGNLQGAQMDHWTITHTKNLVNVTPGF